MLVINIINEYYIFVILSILILTILAIFIAIIANYSSTTKSFKDNYFDSKTVQISMTIDFEEKIVEKYYLYDQSRKNEVIPLEEFFVRFDKINAEKLKNWLESISESNDFNKTRRIELVMYNSNNARGVYLVELDGYNAENKRYFLTFKDVTESISLLKRIEKTNFNRKKEDFFDKVNERLLVSDENSNNFLVAIKYKEYEYTY